MDPWIQLWVALPPDQENGPNGSRYLEAGHIPRAGPARVVLGEYGGASSPIDAPPMNYLAVELEDGERWVYESPAGHDVAWLAVMDGALDAPEPIAGGELAIFEESEQVIALVARGRTRFVLGSASKHPHDLVLGHYSVHTSHAALRQGEAEIRRIGRELTAAGKRSYALQRFG